MPPYSLRCLAWAGPLAVLLAVLFNALYFLTTKALGEQYLLPLDESAARFGPMPLGMPLLTTAAIGLAAVLFFAFLIRFARRPVTVFLSVAVTALVVSFGGPFNLPAAPLQTKLLLCGMNVCTAVLLSGGMLLLSRSQKSNRG